MTLESILKGIKEELQVSEMELKSKSHKRDIVWARYFFYELATRELKWSELKTYEFLNISRSLKYALMRRHREGMVYDNIYRKHFYNCKEKCMDVYEVKPGIEITKEQFLNSKIVNKYSYAQSELY